MSLFNQLKQWQHAARIDTAAIMTPLFTEELV